MLPFTFRLPVPIGTFGRVFSYNISYSNCVPNIILAGQSIAYQLKRYPRSRSVRLRVYPGGAVSISAPTGFSLSAIDRFIAKNSAWLLEKFNLLRDKPVAPKRTLTRAEYLKHRAAARIFVHAKLAEWNKRYGFVYHRIAIKNTRTSWGSCSARGNLNFNYRLLFLPELLADYVIVHELCHLKEPNHSPRFWSLVAQTFPNHRTLRASLREHSLRSFPSPACPPKL